MEEDAIYIARPSRRRSLAFGLLTLSTIGIVGGVWFYMMENVIADAATQARTQAAEVDQIIEDYNAGQNWGQDFSEIFDGLDDLMQPLVIPVPVADPNATLEAATAVIKDKVISEAASSATSDLEE